MIAGQAGSAIQTALALREAKAVRAFQERMYKNRYRYTMEDMRNSGLNPILAATVGGGTQPQGAMGKIADLGGAGKDAFSAMRLKSEIELMKTQKLKTDQDTATSYGQERKFHAEAKSAKAQAALIEQRLPEAKRSKDVFDTPYMGQGIKFIDELMRAVSPFKVRNFQGK